MNSECSICFEIVRSNRVTDSKPNSGNPFITRCGHLFHENCIKDCLKSQRYQRMGFVVHQKKNSTHFLHNFSKCPQCQQQVLSSQLIRVYVNEPENSSKQKDEVVSVETREMGFWKLKFLVLFVDRTVEETIEWFKWKGSTSIWSDRCIEQTDKIGEGTKVWKDKICFVNDSRN